MTKIVIVDDESTERTRLHQVLSEMSMADTFEAEGGIPALQAVSEHEPDIVFLDVEMPDKNGMEVLKEIKRQKPDTFVIMVSDYSSVALIKKSMEHGAEGFLVKPCTRRKLEHLICEFHDKNREQSF